MPTHKSTSEFGIGMAVVTRRQTGDGLSNHMPRPICYMSMSIAPFEQRVKMASTWVSEPCFLLLRHCTIEYLSL
jgi:hypothetical protein